MSIGKGTKTGKALRGFVEEIEAVRERKKQLGEIEKAAFARAKAEGFDVKTLRKILTLRTQDANERSKAQDLLDSYMHALDMAEPPELFKSIGTLAVDRASRDALIDAFKGLVPDTGEIVLKFGGKPVRIFRDGTGEPQAEEVVDDPPPKAKPAAPVDDDDTVYVSPGARRPSTSHVMSAADRAEEAARRKREAAVKAPA